MPKVSVLMPCFNAEKTLEETLASISAQTYQDFETILVDDGSTDSTPDILSKWAKRDSRFRFFSLDHAGIIPALNAGLEICEGTYIARMDADDLMSSQRLLLQAQFLDEHPSVSLVSSLVAGFPKGDIREGFQIYIDWLNSLQIHKDITREIFVESPLCHPSVMFRKQDIVMLGGYQERGWAEDYDLWLRMYQAELKFLLKFFLH